MTDKTYIESSAKDLVSLIKNLGYEIEVKSGSGGFNSMYLIYDKARVHKINYESDRINARVHQNDIDNDLSINNIKANSNFGYGIKEVFLSALCHATLVRKSVSVKEIKPITDNLTDYSDRLLNNVLKEFGINREQFEKLAADEVKQKKTTKIRPA